MSASDVPGDVAPIVQVWTQAMQVPGIQSNVRAKRDLETKMNELFIKLRDRQLEEGTLKLLTEMTNALSRHEWGEALNCQKQLASGANWTAHGQWLMAAKHVIQVNQQGR